MTVSAENSNAGKKDQESTKTKNTNHDKVKESEGGKNADVETMLRKICNEISEIKTEFEDIKQRVMKIEDKVIKTNKGKDHNTVINLDEDGKEHEGERYNYRNDISNNYRRNKRATYSNRNYYERKNDYKKREAEQSEWADSSDSFTPPEKERKKVNFRQDIMADNKDEEINQIKRSIEEKNNQMNNIEGYLKILIADLNKNKTKGKNNVYTTNNNEH